MCFDTFVGIPFFEIDYVESCFRIIEDLFKRPCENMW